MSRLTRALGLAALGTGAALYFLRTISSTIEWLDEGMIVHASWRAARGELPYVDVPHMYGPSLFFVNGALFRLFGEDLHVIRLCLVVLKALIVVEAFALARAVASPVAALVAVVALVAFWGAPVWLVNVPYATYYATPLCLAGFLLLVRERETAARLFVAGLAFGVAATFKQTQGLFACLCGVLLVVATAPAGARRAGSTLAVLALLAVVAFALFYVGERLATATTLLTVGPLVGCCAWFGWRAVRRGTGDPARLLGRLVALAGGVAIPLAACALFYARRGALGTLVFDTLVGLPQRITWFYPLPQPPARTLCFGGVVLASVALVVPPARRHRWAAGGTLALSAILLATQAARDPGWPAYVIGWGWSGEFVALLPWLPFLGLALAVAGLRRENGDRRALALVTFVAAGAILQLYPGADVPHVVMGLPAFVPLLAYALTRAAAGGRPAGLALTVAWTLSAALPFIRTWLSPEPPSSGRFVRASGITDPSPAVADAAEVVRMLPALAGTGRPMLVTSDERLLYFLADRESALPRDEFMLYLVGSGLIGDADARALSPEDAMIAALGSTRPVVVGRNDTFAAVRFRSAFPRVAAWLDAQYAPVRTVGTYRVQLPRAEGGAPVDSGGTPRLDAPRPALEPAPR